MPQKEPIFRCYKCGEDLHFDVKIGRRDMCPNCYAYLHCCKNCQYWDVSVHNECTENRAEFIRDREEGRFCLYFTFKEAPDESQAEEGAAKAQIQKMFGVSLDDGSRDPKTEDEARKRLERLFKK